MCEAPERWRILQGDIQGVLFHVFPYAVLYSIGPNRIYIIAVMHCGWKPGYWQCRTD